MRSVRNVLITIGTAAMLAGCAHSGRAAGDVAVDPDLASRTTVLKVDNRDDSEMRVFAVTNGKENYLGTVAAKQAREFTLDPALIGSEVSFTARVVDTSDSRTRGPFRLGKGSIVEYLIPARSTDQTNPPAVPPHG